MPYIVKERRPAIDKALESVNPMTYGELNYTITKLVQKFLGYPTTLKQSYESYNSAMGVLECVKQELYRRAIAPYEDTKVAANGDVY